VRVGPPVAQLQDALADDLAAAADESEPTYLAFFAGKTISSVRAPDSYVYPAPFNVRLPSLPLRRPGEVQR